MRIQERREGDLTVLDLEGDLLIGEGDELLRERVNSLIAEGRIQITLNLTDVRRIDSGGLGEMVRCYTTVSRKNGQLQLLNPSETIQKLFSRFGDDDDEWPSGAAGATSLGAVFKIRPKH